MREVEVVGIVEKEQGAERDYTTGCVAFILGM